MAGVVSELFIGLVHVHVNNKAALKYIGNSSDARAKVIRFTIKPFCYSEGPFAQVLLRAQLE